MSPALAQPRINNGGWKHYINDDWFDRPELARDPDLERLAFRLSGSPRRSPTHSPATTNSWWPWASARTPSPPS